MPPRHASSATREPRRTAGKPSLIGRVRYRLDLALSRGSLMVVGYLGVITLAITAAAAGIVTVLHLSGVNGGPKLGFAESFWQSMLRMLGKGAFATDQEWPTRVLSLIVTLAGIFLAGALIALIAASVNLRINRLRKGRSAVLESGHTLVLGWSPRLPVILSELVVANANQRRAAFVILAERPKDEMEDELRRLVPHTRTTRVVCRTGDPSKPADLALVNVTGARSVIVLADEEGDAGVVKTVLAVRSLDPNFDRTRLVAELGSASHAETLRSLTDERIATVQADQVISQVTAQACHQSGLAGVFRDLLAFDGADIYIKPDPQLAGHTYEEVQLAFDTSSIIGVCRDGAITLNPPDDYMFADEDEIIAISDDDDTVLLTGFGTQVDIEVGADVAFTEPAQHIAIVGWSPLGTEVIRELDQVLGDGSAIDLLIDDHPVDAEEVQLPNLAHCTINVRPLPQGPEALIDVITACEYDQAIVLGYRHRMDANKADARTMVTLLAMHKAWTGRTHRPRVVAEMLDRANVEIAQTIEVDDFIVSDELSSLMLAQVSERLELNRVFGELFDAAGSFVSLRPAELYAPTHTISYAAVVAAASRRGESAIGYRIGSRAVTLNPRKSARVTLGPGDQVLVLGERTARPAAVTVFPARVVSQHSLNGAKLTAAVSDAND